jgi:hypothetical protein
VWRTVPEDSTSRATCRIDFVPGGSNGLLFRMPAKYDLPMSNCSELLVAINTLGVRFGAVRAFHAS